MGTGNAEGRWGPPEPSEQVESPNKTYLFHLRSVCALHGRGGEGPRGLGNSISQIHRHGEWSLGRQGMRGHPRLQVVPEAYACEGP